MTRRTHPMDRLVAPLGVDKAETWVECGSRCELHWRVTLRNDNGDTRTQAGSIPGQPPQDNSGWFQFWRRVAGLMSRYRLELALQPYVNGLTVHQLKLIGDMQTPDDMQTWGDLEFHTVKYLCNLRLDKIP